jgi:hypothetical protein
LASAKKDMQSELASLIVVMKSARRGRGAMYCLDTATRVIKGIADGKNAKESNGIVVAI